MKHFLHKPQSERNYSRQSKRNNKYRMPIQELNNSEEFNNFPSPSMYLLVNPGESFPRPIQVPPLHPPACLRKKPQTSLMAWLKKGLPKSGVPHAKKQQKPCAKAVHKQKGIQPPAASNDTGREGLRACISFGFNFFSCGKLAIKALVPTWFYFKGWSLLAVLLFLSWHKFVVCFTGIIPRCTDNSPAPYPVQE